MIALSRREGKNRRDNATVSTRVVGLADRMGRELFESNAATTSDDTTVIGGNGDGMSDAEPEKRKEKGKRARREIQGRPRL
jgi:hypothetical protein